MLLATYSPPEPPTPPEAWGMVMLLGIAAIVVARRRLKRHPHWTNRLELIGSVATTISCVVGIFGGPDLWLWVIWTVTAGVMFAVYAAATANHVTRYSQQWFLFLAWCCAILAAVTLILHDDTDALLFIAFAVCGFAAWGIRGWLRRRAGG